MTTSKKLTLLLLPLVPLTAIGIVEVAGTIVSPDQAPICDLPATPAPTNTQPAPLEPGQPTVRPALLVAPQAGADA